MTSARLLPFLESLPRRARFGMVLDLDRMRVALAKLGDPHLAIPFVHIAGTNGKGSTSAMVESIMRSAGLRTGLYTSPHLCRLAERVRIDGEPADDDMFADALERATAAAPEDGTFFEILTLAAFVSFKLARVDVGVLEVGLGGRLDATNVVPRPLATAITSIAFDHTAILGSSLAEIAREKAGIFKNGVPVVLGPLVSEALTVVLEVAANVGASPVLRVGTETGNGDIVVANVGDGVEIVIPSGVWGEGRPEAPDVQTGVWGEGRLEAADVRPGFRVRSVLSLDGAHQAANAAVAVGLSKFASMMFPQILPAIERGLSSARWPGRLERIERDGKVVLLDCAHNPEGAAAVVAYVRARGFPPDRVVLVFGALGDKAWATMLDALGPLGGRRVYAAPKGRAPAPVAAMAERYLGEIVSEPRAAIARALELARAGDLVLVAGSIFLVGEVRAELLGLECDPIVAL